MFLPTVGISTEADRLLHGIARGAIEISPNGALKSAGVRARIL